MFFVVEITATLLVLRYKSKQLTLCVHELRVFAARFASNKT